MAAGGIGASTGNGSARNSLMTSAMQHQRGCDRADSGNDRTLNLRLDRHNAPGKDAHALLRAKPPKAHRDACYAEIHRPTATCARPMLSNEHHRANEPPSDLHAIGRLVCDGPVAIMRIPAGSKPEAGCAAGTASGVSNLEFRSVSRIFASSNRRGTDFVFFVFLISEQRNARIAAKFARTKMLMRLGINHAPHQKETNKKKKRGGRKKKKRRPPKTKNTPTNINNKNKAGGTPLPFSSPPPCPRLTFHSQYSRCSHSSILCPLSLLRFYYQSFSRRAIVHISATLLPHHASMPSTSPVIYPHPPCFSYVFLLAPGVVVFFCLCFFFCLECAPPHHRGFLHSSSSHHSSSSTASNSLSLFPSVSYSSH